MKLMKIYDNAPFFLQTAACSILGYKIQQERYNPIFFEKLREWENHNGWNYERLCEYRDARIQNRVQYCYENIPYYYKMMEEGGIDPCSIKKLDDLKKLPVINKQIVKENSDAFKIMHPDKMKLYRCHTSGSTGSGLVFYWTKEAMIQFWVNSWRFFHRLGIERTMWEGHFGGKPVVPAECKNKPWGRVNYPGRQVYFSAYHMSEENLQGYCDAINRYKLQWIHGYPSSITMLAKYVLENAIEFEHPVKYITVCSENIYDHQISMIERAFHILPYQNYGQTENVARFEEDIEHRFRVVEDYAAVEFVDVNGDGRHHIIGTDLWNDYMPFLRYDTNDIAFCEEKADGRYISSLDGRAEDYIYLLDGSKVGRMDHLFKDMENVSAAQIVQNSMGRVTLCIVRNAAYNENDENKIKNELEQRFAKRLQYEINYCEKLEVGKNGKQRFIINTIK